MGDRATQVARARCTMKLALALALMISPASAYVSALAARSCRRAVSASMALLEIKTEPWEESPASRAVYIRARVEGSQKYIGECGVEIQDCTSDGLVDEGAAGVKPRALLSGTLHVHRSFRRKGVAQRLLREAENKARSWGMGSLLLLVDQDNEPALRLYANNVT